MRKNFPKSNKVTSSEGRAAARRSLLLCHILFSRNVNGKSAGLKGESATKAKLPRYTFLVHSHWAARLHLLHQEDERDHYDDAPPDEPEIVDVSEHRSLLMNHVRDHRVRLLRCKP